MLRVRTCVWFARPTCRFGELAQIRHLLDRAFTGRFDDTDWVHGGGLHVVLVDHDRVVAHATVVQRHLVHDRQPIRTGYLEAVAVGVDRCGCDYAGQQTWP